MKVFYTEHAGSEYDYILYDILSNIEKDVELFNKTTLLSLLNRPDIIKRKMLEHFRDSRMNSLYGGKTSTL
jgi:hypothetical protein